MSVRVEVRPDRQRTEPGPFSATTFLLAQVTPGVYTFLYTSGVVPEVLSVRELRAGLAAVIDRVQRGAAVFVGAHRRAEVVLVSVEQYEALVRAARRREAVAEALASVRAEGLEPTLDGLEQLERLAAGEIGEDDAIEALRRRHRR